MQEQNAADMAAMTGCWFFGKSDGNTSPQYKGTGQGISTSGARIKFTEQGRYRFCAGFYHSNTSVETFNVYLNNVVVATVNTPDVPYKASIAEFEADIGSTLSASVRYDGAGVNAETIAIQRIE